MAPQARELRYESSTGGHTDRVKKLTVYINLIKNTEIYTTRIVIKIIRTILVQCTIFCMGLLRI